MTLTYTTVFTSVHNICVPNHTPFCICIPRPASFFDLIPRTWPHSSTSFPDCVLRLWQTVAPFHTLALLQTLPSFPDCELFPRLHSQNVASSQNVAFTDNSLIPRPWPSQTIAFPDNSLSPRLWPQTIASFPDDYLIPRLWPHSQADQFS